ncbi:hypothetical protein HMPREF0290_0214, partial [Corynebacterium efficiens YS-314]
PEQLRQGRGLLCPEWAWRHPESGSTRRARRGSPHPVQVQRHRAWESQNPASARPSG